MKKLRKTKKLLTITAVIMLSLMMLFSSTTQAAGKTKLNSTKKTINVGDSCTVKLLNNKKKVKWSVSNKNIKIISKNNKQAKIKGVKKGASYLSAKVGSKTYKCKVTVKSKNNGNGVVYKDKNVLIKFIGLEKESYGNGYDIKISIKNLSKRSIVVQARESSINGIMVDPVFSVDISPGKTDIDEMSIWGDDAKNVPFKKVKNIETKFFIGDWSDSSFGYITKIVKIK